MTMIDMCQKMTNAAPGLVDRKLHVQQSVHGTRVCSDARDTMIDMCQKITNMYARNAHKRIRYTVYGIRYTVYVEQKHILL